MRRRNKIFISLSLCFFASLLLLGCGREALYNNLSQEDANKVMVLLEKNAIDASLEQQVFQNEVSFAIKVNKQDMAKARELIVSSQVISPRSPGLKEVYQGKGASGWIKTPAEERARYLLALKGEIVNSLKKLPGVVDVDCVLNIPEEEALGLKEKKRPTASVVIKAETPEQGESTLSEVQIQQFVANAVEGMSARDVSVLLHFVAPVGTKLRPGQTVLLPKTPETGAEEPSHLMGLKLDSSSKERLKVYLIVFFLILLVLSAALVVSIVQARRTRSELKDLQGGQMKALGGRALEEGEAPRLRAPEREEEERPPEG